MGGEPVPAGIPGEVLRPEGGSRGCAQSAARVCGRRGRARCPPYPSRGTRRTRGRSRSYAPRGARPAAACSASAPPTPPSSDGCTRMPATWTGRASGEASPRKWRCGPATAPHRLLARQPSPGADRPRRRARRHRPVRGGPRRRRPPRPESMGHVPCTNRPTSPACSASEAHAESVPAAPPERRTTRGASCPTRTGGAEAGLTSPGRAMPRYGVPVLLKPLSR